MIGADEEQFIARFQNVSGFKFHVPGFKLNRENMKLETF
jgi:hypothetical protein